MNVFFVFIGGGLGSVTRYLFSAFLNQPRFSILGLQLGTISSNVLSSLILGIIVGMLGHGNKTSLYLFLAVGFCGGFSTFSTFSLENFLLLREGYLLAFFLNTLVSLLICLLCVSAGFVISSNITS